MISEVEKLVKGRLVATDEYENTKKVIGVSNSNLTPGEDGFCLLGKQSAFKKEETPAEPEKSVEEVPTMSENVPEVKEELPEMPSSEGEKPEEEKAPEAPKAEGETPEVKDELPEMPSLEELGSPLVGEDKKPEEMTAPEMPSVDTTEPAPAADIPAAKVSDTISDNPIEMGSLTELETLIPDKPLVDAPAVPESPKTEENVSEPTEPVLEEMEMPALDIQMPVLDTEVVAGEPSGIDNALFEDGNKEEKKEDNAEVVSQVVGPSIELEVPTLDMPTLDNNTTETPSEDNKLEDIKVPEGLENTNGNVMNEIIAKKMDEFVLTLNKDFKERTENFKKEINELLSGKFEETKVETEVFEAPEVPEVPGEKESNMPEVESPEANLMNDALSQLESMVNPLDQSAPTL